jgi:hypothetical protein
MHFVMRQVRLLQAWHVLSLHDVSLFLFARHLLDHLKSMFVLVACSGGWILGNTIDGTQAEYIRIPHADNSLYHIPKGANPEALTMLSDIFPTGFECGVLNGKVQPGSSPHHHSNLSYLCTVFI